MQALSWYFLPTFSTYVNVICNTQDYMDDSTFKSATEPTN